MWVQKHPTPPRSDHAGAPSVCGRVGPGGGRGRRDVCVCDILGVTPVPQGRPREDEEPHGGDRWPAGACRRPGCVRSRPSLRVRSQPGVLGPGSSLTVTGFSLKTRLRTGHSMGVKVTHCLFWAPRGRNAGDVPQWWWRLMNAAPAPARPFPAATPRESGLRHPRFTGEEDPGRLARSLPGPRGRGSRPQSSMARMAVHSTEVRLRPLVRKLLGTLQRRSEITLR